MKTLQWSVKLVDWQSHEQQLSGIRRTVFIDEQNVPEEEEWDVHDKEAQHLLAVDENGGAIATARVLNFRIGRIAVLKAYRGQGVGDALVRCLIEATPESERPRLYLHAQTYALPFYQKLGFVAEGDEFMDAGIPHINMVYRGA